MDRGAALKALLISDEPTISPAQAAAVLGCDADTLRRQIAADASKLGFPVSRIGAWYRIPREPFIKYLKGTK